MRYAIYFAPDLETLLHDLGSRWLGRDAFGGHALEQPSIAGLDVLTAEARRYGFHATLKAPFELAEHADLTDLTRAARQFAAGESPLSHAMMVDLVDGFLALVPAGPVTALNALAARCVRAFDGFRKPPSAAEHDKRRAAGLTANQEAHLTRWGYPYVFDEFRFHMTLSRRLSNAEAAVLVPAAQLHFRPALREPIAIDSITLFSESGPGMPLEAIAQFALTRLPAEAAS